MQSSRLEARLLGGFALSINGVPLAIPKQPREQALLTYLILHAATPQTRQSIAFAFWPDSTEERAFANLRYSLHHLRRSCPELAPYLLTTQSTLHWQPGRDFWLDSAEFSSLVKQIDEVTEVHALRTLLIHATELYRGDLLPSCYDDWVIPQREQLAQHNIHVLERLVDLLVVQKEPRHALEVAIRLRYADPLRERTYQRLMELHAAAGDRAAALQIYRECKMTLADELNVEPSSETQAIYARLIQDDTEQSPVVQPAFAQTRLLNMASLPLRVEEVIPAADQLVGRERELRQLMRVWSQASLGHPHVVLIRGEGGIGKTRLAEEVVKWVAQQGHATVYTRAYAAEGQLIYAPIINWLRAERYQSRLRQLDDVWLVELARLLPEVRAERPDLPTPAPLTDNWQRQLLFEALARAVLSIDLPLLVLIDDLQWVDQETLEWLHYLLRFDPTAALMVVGTARIEEVNASHPLLALQMYLMRAGQIEEINLQPLDAESSAQLAQLVADKRLEPTTVMALYDYAKGVPLFLVEAVRAGLEPDNVEPWQRPNTQLVPSDSTQTPVALPPRIYAVLQARLMQLSADGRAIVDIAAVIGRAFSLELLQLASGATDETVIRALDELWKRRIVFAQGLDYDISHDRIRDVAYAELSPIQRRRLHHKVAQALEQNYAIDVDTMSAQLAWHYEAAGQFRQAISSYARAGAVAQRVYANARASDLLRKGLDLLNHLPPNEERDRQELALQIALAASVRTKGYVVREVSLALDRAWELSRRLGDVRHLFWALSGLFAYHFIKGEVTRCQALSAELLAIAEQEGKAELLLVAHSDAGASYMHSGVLMVAQRHFTQCAGLYTPELHENLVIYMGLDYGVLMPSWRAHHAWMIGEPDQALRHSQNALDVTQRLAHPLSQALAMVYRSMIHQFRREWDLAHAQAVQLLALTSEHEMIYYQRWAAILVELEVARHAPSPATIANLRAALERYKEIDAAMRLPFFLAGLAEIYAMLGELDAALETLTAAQTVAETQGEHWWDAEIMRLHGDISLQQGADIHHVEAILQHALTIAQQQHAQTLALRAATSLARLWQQDGRTATATNLLAPLYAQFTEGFDTTDLQSAKALLIDLQ